MAVPDAKFEHMLVMSWMERGMSREEAVGLYNEIINIEIIEEDNVINTFNDGRH